MKFIEIIVIILASGYVSLILGRYIYKRIKHLPTGECSSCKLAHSGQGLKEYYLKHKCDCENKE